MNRKTLVIAMLAVVLAVFAVATWMVSRPGPAPVTVTAAPEEQDRLDRAYSPSFGPDDAPVTIVEFFDPACEACRAFHPIVKALLAKYPEDLRVVMRYTPFHGEGSELAAKVLETARMQDLFLPVLEAFYDNQQTWASHGAPAAEMILDIAGAAGLDVATATDQIKSPGVVAALNQDKADVEALQIQGTPTFFVNGKPLPEFGSKQLVALVESEVEAAKNKQDK